MSIILGVGPDCESGQCGLLALGYSDPFYGNLSVLFSGDNVYPMHLAIPIINYLCRTMIFPTANFTI